jgi:hypothetical protein
MSVEKYIKDQKERGDWDSAGAFTLDLKASSLKMSRYRLPSENHHLLKLLQLAVFLGAPSAKVCLSLRESRVSFISKTDPLPASLQDLLSVEDPLEGFAASVLMSGLSARIAAIVWKATTNEKSRTLRLESSGLVESSGSRLPPGNVRHDFSLIHPSSWRFWESAQRRREGLDLIRESTRFAGLEIELNQRKPKLTPVAILNDHVSDFGGSQFNAATGVMQNTRGPAVASNLVFLLSEGTDPRVRVASPPLTAFSEEEGCIVWAQAGLKPDGSEVPTWMLQYISNSQNLSFMDVHEDPLCRAVMVLNIHGPGNMEDLRVTVVRYGVTVLETTESVRGNGLEDLVGCSLLFADEDLDTDLAGLSVIKNEKYYQKLRSFIPLAESGHRYFQQASRSLAI